MLFEKLFHANKNEEKNTEPIFQNVDEDLPKDVDYAMMGFCRKYQVLMKILHKDMELNQWCKAYSAYQEIHTHKELKTLIYDGFMKDAYDMPFFKEYLAETDYSISWEQRLHGTKKDLIKAIFLEIRADYGSNGYTINISIADGIMSRLLDAYIDYDANKTKKNVEEAKNPYLKYRLDEIVALEGKRPPGKAGARSVFHDVSMKKWRMTVQLDEQKYWFLSIFFHEDGRFEKYSLDYEGSSDSHYEFNKEKEIRKILYVQGDESKYFDSVLVRYVAEYGGDELLKIIRPYITAQFHFD